MDDADFLPEQVIKERGFTHIRQADDTALNTHKYLVKTGPSFRRRCVELLHGVIQTPFDQQWHDANRLRNSPLNGRTVINARPAKHPWRDLVFKARVTNTYPQTVKLAMPEQSHSVTQAVLPSVPSIKL